MMRVLLTVSMVALLAACSEEGSGTNDVIDNTPAETQGTAPTDRDPTPQTGSGGQSPVENSPTGTQQQ
jgi:PBP1b-binding outer membrane lipoprotein LpoB